MRRPLLSPPHRPAGPQSARSRHWTAAIVGIACALFGGLATPEARAWNASGHRLIAAMAWMQFDAAQRREIHALLTAHPALPDWQRAARSSAARELFIESSAWPDAVRQQRQPRVPAHSPERAIGPRRTWHYVNIPLTNAQDGTPQPRGGALHRALPYLAQRLGDHTLPIAERADALVWLNHLVGDAHQPLHVAGRFHGTGRRGHDAGGNGFAVRLPSSRGGVSNLHRVWDNLPGGGGLRGGRLDRRAARLRERGPAATPAGGVTTWLAESHALAASGVYPPGPSPATLTPEYLAWAQARADEQLVHAARRLATTVAGALAATDGDR